ncbi:metal transporter [Streptomyces sp. NBC_00576]|uniref:metal transporter n=1 Tax=Streptomyces sp. NBC_00576 TaxID=2903665 RepID=UPI002E80AC27|nr:metal transporter [Streptomyces sp. NBC_00576]WUB68670.1 metal transporter [Streptomyces sp. NBC_00576]WUB77027.1 metal transporter [Streptomyces sp. NBC_00576]
MLGVVFALGIVFTAFMFMTSWGGTSWVFGSAVSIVMGGIALVRERHKLLTALAGLVVTAGAIAVSLKVGDDLPEEPAPITALALSVLVGSAIRTLPAAQGAVIALGGLVVTAVPWVDGLSGVTSLATMGMIAALVLGPVLRALDHRALTEAPQGSWAGPPRS